MTLPYSLTTFPSSDPEPSLPFRLISQISRLVSVLYLSRPAANYIPDNVTFISIQCKMEIKTHLVSNMCFGLKIKTLF